MATHHFTVLKDKQEGNGLNTLSQALQDVRVLQHSVKTADVNNDCNKVFKYFLYTISVRFVRRLQERQRVLLTLL